MNSVIKSKIQSCLSNFSFNSGVRLSELSDHERTELHQEAKTVKLAKKNVLYSEGETPKGIYILQKGKIKISQLNFDGSIQIHFIYAEGEVFGHRPILANDNQPVSATALEDCELLFIDKDQFLRVLHKSHHFSRMLMQSISHEFTLLVNRINIFAQKGIKERLALFLLMLNDIYKKNDQAEEEADITLNRNDLAGYIGTSVENLVRTLKVFKENGYIRTSGKSILINDFEALHSLTGI